jgi:hypothetical protein
MSGVCVRQRQQIRVAFFTVQCTVYIERKVTIGRVVSVSSADLITRLQLTTQLDIPPLKFSHQKCRTVVGDKKFFCFCW